jgi:hypothetical protein
LLLQQTELSGSRGHMGGGKESQSETQQQNGRGDCPGCKYAVYFIVVPLSFAPGICMHFM